MSEPHPESVGGPLAPSAVPARPPRGLLAATVAVPLLGLALLTLVVQRLDSSGTIPPGPGPADFEAKPAAENRPAPAFDLPALAGPGRIGLRSFSGSVVVLNVWASWCGPCRQEAPELESVWIRYRTRGVQFIGVDHQDARDDALAFVREFGISYPSGFDPSGSVASRYGAVGIPTTFVIDRDGRIVYRFLGRVRAPVLTAILDQLVAVGP